MNEAQLILQSHALIEKNKRDQCIEMQKFLLVRDSILEVLGIRIEAPPHEFELHDTKFEKSYAFPLIYMLGTIVGTETINKMLSSYTNMIVKSKNEVKEDANKEEDFNNVFDLISQGHTDDDIVKELTGFDVEELINNAVKRDKDLEVSQVSSTKEELEEIRKSVMNDTPPKKNKKPVQFTIKTGE